MKLLHISDTHIRGDGDEELRKRFALIQQFEGKIILTGDVTDDGSEEQYGVASNLLQSLRERLYLCPGNHDYGWQGILYSEDAAKRFDQFCGQTFVGQTPYIGQIPRVSFLEDAVLISLNSCLETANPFDFACGQIGAGQLIALKNILNDPIVRSGATKILCLHHHPFIHGDPTMELLDARDFLRTIYRKVDILLFGHKHVKGRWENKAGCTLVLASGATFQEPFAWQITIEQNKIFSEEVPIL
jgi:3',5'-cyclic AMP phosphodiesterase CpdA